MVSGRNSSWESGTPTQQTPLSRFRTARPGDSTPRGTARFEPATRAIDRASSRPASQLRQKIGRSGLQAADASKATGGLQGIDRNACGKWLPTLLRAGRHSGLLGRMDGWLDTSTDWNRDGTVALSRCCDQSEHVALLSLAPCGRCPHAAPAWPGPATPSGASLGFSPDSGHLFPTGTQARALAVFRAPHTRTKSRRRQRPNPISVRAKRNSCTKPANAWKRASWFETSRPSL